MSVGVYVEAGKARTFAGALDWPGWCRSGRDEASALDALLAFGPRYAKVLQTTDLAFSAPTERSSLVVVERVSGNATTDFGAPNLTLQSDTNPVIPSELERWHELLVACWHAFDEVVQATSGQTLRTGPRGGGRTIEQITQHAQEVDASYLTRLGGKDSPSGQSTLVQVLTPLRLAILATLEAAVSGAIPTLGPRGATRWTPRYFVRRLAWHELDHAWEVEDRSNHDVGARV